MKAFIETACWFAAGMLLWLVTVSTITVTELIVAAATSAACGTFATAARRITGLRARPTRAWLRWAALVPVQAVTDTARLVAWLATGAHERSETDATAELHVAAGTSPVAVGARAAVVGMVSATPGSVALDADDGGRLLVHRLVGGWPELDERVTR